MAISRRTLISLALVDVVLFIVANATYHHNRDLSNVAWVGFVIGFVVLIVLVVAALIRSRRSAH